MGVVNSFIGQSNDILFGSKFHSNNTNYYGEKKTPKNRKKYRKLHPKGGSQGGPRMWFSEILGFLGPPGGHHGSQTSPQGAPDPSGPSFLIIFDMLSQKTMIRGCTSKSIRMFWKSIAFHGFQGNSIGFNGFPWNSVEIYRIRWNFMEFQRLPKSSMEFFGIP